MHKLLYEIQALVQSFEDDLQSQLALSKISLLQIRQYIIEGRKLVRLLEQRLDALRVDAYYTTGAATAVTNKTEG